MLAFWTDLSWKSFSFGREKRQALVKIRRGRERAGNVDSSTMGLGAAKQRKQSNNAALSPNRENPRQKLINRKNKKRPAEGGAEGRMTRAN